MTGGSPGRFTSIQGSIQNAPLPETSRTVTELGRSTLHASSTLRAPLAMELLPTPTLTTQSSPSHRRGHRPRRRPSPPPPPCGRPWRWNCCQPRHSRPSRHLPTGGSIEPELVHEIVRRL